MIAYELLAHLHHLRLTGVDEDGELEWKGTKEQWEAVANEIKQYEESSEEDSE